MVAPDGGMFVRIAGDEKPPCIFTMNHCAVDGVPVFITPARTNSFIGRKFMKPDYIAEIVAASIRVDGGTVSPFDARELARMIVSRAVNRDRFIQKIKSPTFEWKKPPPKR
jgi:hypothetical protein